MTVESIPAHLVDVTFEVRDHGLRPLAAVAAGFCRVSISQVGRRADVVVLRVPHVPPHVLAHLAHLLRGHPAERTQQPHRHLLVHCC